MKTFTQWMEDNYGAYGGLPYGAENTPQTSVQTQPQVNPQTTQPTMNMNGVPPALVQQLQKTGPKMQGIMNRANQLQQQKKIDLSAALQAAMKETPNA